METRGGFHATQTQRKGINIKASQAHDTRPTPCAIVVEDEFLARWLIAEVLRDFGFAVYEFGTADDALAYLQSGGRADVVFTDIRMPGAIDGLELVRRIHENIAPQMPVVVTSSHPPEGSSFLPVAFVPKPYNPHATAALLSRLAAGGK